MRGWWRRWRDERALQRRAIDDDLWLQTLRRYPFLRRRTLEDLLALRRMTSLFLDRKQFSGAGGIVVTDAIAVAIAAQACVPVLKLAQGLDWYDGFVGIVVQPSEVVAPREWTDEHGIVHSGEEVLAGEAMPGGPLMLSWQDVEAAAQGQHTGYNVVIHEFAHVIDMSDGGEADGIPPLPSAAARAAWHDTLAREHATLCRRLEAGQDTGIDPYAAGGLEEFFAVCAEAFFVAPRLLAAEHAATYALLRQFFGQDPLAHAR